MVNENTRAKTEIEHEVCYSLLQRTRGLFESLFTQYQTAESCILVKEFEGKNIPQLELPFMKAHEGKKDN